jgi:hypothetical protein
MSLTLLQRAENHLGYVYDWPAVILKYLFIDPPTFLQYKHSSAFSTGKTFPKKWQFNYLKLVTIWQILN